VDQETRRRWINTYRQRARMTRADLKELDVPINDLLAGHVARRLQTLIEIYDAGIEELQQAEDD
jgi:hypothetical protein